MISVKDLKEAFVILGKQPTDDELKKMVAEAPGPISFTAMLNMFADHLNGKIFFKIVEIKLIFKINSLKRH